MALRGSQAAFITCRRAKHCESAPIAGAHKGTGSLRRLSVAETPAGVA